MQFNVLQLNGWLNRRIINNNECSSIGYSRTSWIFVAKDDDQRRCFCKCYSTHTHTKLIHPIQFEWENIMFIMFLYVPLIRAGIKSEKCPSLFCLPTWWLLLSNMNYLRTVEAEMKHINRASFIGWHNYVIRIFLLYTNTKGARHNSDFHHTLYVMCCRSSKVVENRNLLLCVVYNKAISC